MKHKRFDKSLYAQFDAKAKAWVKEILPKNLTAKESDGRMEVDLIVRDAETDEIKFYIEPEVKVVWTDEFKYDTVHLPFRKKKYCNLDHPTLFIIFRKDGAKYFCFWSKQVLNSPLKEVPNKYIASNEFFYDLAVKNTFSDVNDAIKNIRFF